MESSAHTLDPRRWQALTVVCVAFFMTVLDVSIVNVALPSIKTSLHVGESSLQWVLIAYTITFGGLLLLGGRAADLLGRRRMFMIGTALFGAASLACGLAGSIGVLVTRFGPRPVMAIGLLSITAGMVWYSQISVHTTFASGLFPGYLLVGVGMAFAFIPMSIAALAGVEPREAGLASGLINTSQQIGGALGVAIAATVAFTHTNTLLHSGHSLAAAQTSGFALGFWVIAGFGAAAVVATLTLVRSNELAVEPEAVQAF